MKETPLAFYRHKLGQTFYLSSGRSNSEQLPLVFLHGGPGGAHYYQRRLMELAKDRKVILYDQIGGGRSTPLASKHQNIATLVQDLDGLLQHLKIDRFHLAGGSWGGSLALEYYFYSLKKKKSNVASLILQSPLVSTADWVKDANRLLKTLSAKDQKTIRLCLEVGATDSKVYKAAEREFTKRYVFRSKDTPEMKAYRKKYPNPHGEEVYNHMWGASEFTCTGTLKSFDRAKDLPKIEVPTLFVCGQYDEATPETLLKYSKKVKQGQLEVIKGGSHSLMSEKPREMLKIVSRFLEQVEV